MNKAEDRRVKKTKQALQSGFAKLLAEKDVTKITVRELTELCDLHRGTFYLHYMDVFDLKKQLEDEVLSAMESRLSACAEATTPAMALLPLFEFYHERMEICSALLGPYGDPEFRKAFWEGIYHSTLERMQLLYSPAPQTMWEMECAFLNGGLMHLLREWPRHAAEISPVKMTEYASGRLFCNSL